MNVAGYFYNPNIHPLIEYRKRLLTVEHFARLVLLPLNIDKEYNLESFLRGALEGGQNRCLFCYRTRLERVFERAAEDRADGVTTTLLYSKYQRHEEIQSIGQELADKHKVRFLYRDFRVGWKAGIEESKRLNMYRQQYCGCIFSERERFQGN